MVPPLLSMLDLESLWERWRCFGSCRVW